MPHIFGTGGPPLLHRKSKARVRNQHVLSILRPSKGEAAQPRTSYVGIQCVHDSHPASTRRQKL